MRALRAANASVASMARLRACDRMASAPSGRVGASTGTIDWQDRLARSPGTVRREPFAGNRSPHDRSQQHLQGFNRMRILVIEDNQDIAANLGDYLEDRGHTVDFAADGITGLHLAIVHEFDAIVLDLNLPGMDGLEVCRKLRGEARKQTPVLMLTARDTLDNKIAGFDSGADDYLVKPFALQEVEVRLNALARRGKGNQTRVLDVGELEYNLDTLEVRRQGKLLQLNPTALKILQALMEASPAVVTRQELETRVWGEELPDSDSLRVHIHGLRAVVDKPFGVPLIQTRHGIGYRIAVPETNA
jgi:DNA-binding response OmpR family regulator